MDSLLHQALQIRYVKLHFVIELLEDTILPHDKVSALRGGIGEMLLRANCIRDRQCKKCDFETECIVQRTMYSKFNKKPEFVTTGESVGYVLECENYQEEFAAGEQLEFRMILFGKTIVYLNQYLQAIFSLGMQGLGKEHSRFQIVGVYNTKKQPLLEDGNIFMERYQVSTVADYVERRLRQLKQKLSTAEKENEIDSTENVLPMGLIFYTPLTLKFHGEFIQEFNMEAIINAIKRRIYMLDCFEGIEGEEHQKKNYPIPVILNQTSRFTTVTRYSNRQRERMQLKGIRGRVMLEHVEPEVLALLLAGELIHIGKNTSFGFGRFGLRETKGEIENDIRGI
jgi:hypothetical protein